MGPARHNIFTIISLFTARESTLENIPQPMSAKPGSDKRIKDKNDIHTGSSLLFTSRISGRGYRNGPICLSVCLCFCVSVSDLSAELFEVWPRNLPQGLTFKISWTSFEVRVIGQRSRSHGRET